EVKRGQQRGPLHGVPLAHKDMFYRAGKVSSGGSKILQDHVATTTATVLERLDAAGAIELGVLNMSEFAAGPTGHNLHFGHCRNAFNAAHIPGGSSSGSAVAVAARAVFGALGSDTGASVRLPAAYNGVTGLKPTYGRVSRHGADRLSALTIGVADHGIAVEPEIAAALEESIRVLERSGAKVVRVALPDLEPLFRVGEAIIKGEAASLHRHWLETRPQNY